MKFNFQIIVVAVFIVAAVFGVLVFSGAIPIGGSEEGSLGTVVLWGTVPASMIMRPLEDFNNANTLYQVTYVEKSAETFDRELLEALAADQGPDMFFLSDDLAYNYDNKIIKIPYTSYSPAAFKNIFAQAGEVFLTSEGIMAFPMSIDPLMLYYNRNMLDGEGIVQPPKDWEEFSLNVAKLTEKDDETKQISRSGAALGQYANVAHAKNILSALFMQAGNPIVAEQNGKKVSTLGEPVGIYDLPSILRFYTSFADPASPVYSWNRSFPISEDAFSNEDLAFYFGYASELPKLVNKNPNQNFFVTPLPQIKDAKAKITTAKVTGIAVSSGSTNLNGALEAASALASSDFAAQYALALGLPPARRDLLAQPPADQFSPIFYNSALIARAWLDPSPEDTENIFGSMVNSVLSNNLNEASAMKDADSKLELLLLQ